MKTVTCKLPDDLDAALESVARAENVSKSAILRRLLVERMKVRKGRARPSAYDVVKRLCGSLRGPRDLSSNPKHLSDLGR